MSRLRIAVFSLFWLGAPGRGNAAIEAIADRDCFRAAVGPVTVVDFEDLPPSGSSCPRRSDDGTLPNPLVLAEVRLVGAGCMTSSFCSAPSCVPDPKSPHRGNIVLHLEPGSRIELPPGTTGVLLEIQGMGSNLFTLRAIDLEGETAEAVSRGSLLGVTHLGFVAAAGLSRLEIVRKEPTDGGVVLSALLVGSGGVGEVCGQPDERLHSLDPAESLTIRFLPELGILEMFSVGDSQSTYFRTTSENREFHRGFAGFDIPDLESGAGEATLFLEAGGTVNSIERPPIVHEISFFGWDGGLQAEDFHRPTTSLSTFETQDQVPSESFSFDVARPINGFLGRRLWFRIKLAVDPDFTGLTALGEGFRVRLDIQAAQAFIRGDANGDGKTNIADAVAILALLFLTGSGVTCLESANVDDNDRIDLTDPVALLQHLFSGSPPPRAPFPDCGSDPDSLSCRSFAACP